MCSKLGKSANSDDIGLALLLKGSTFFGFFCPEKVDANSSPHHATVTYLHSEPFKPSAQLPTSDLKAS